MPNYRRYFVPGGTYFFRLKTERNALIFGNESNARLFARRCGLTDAMGLAKDRSINNCRMY